MGLSRHPYLYDTLDNRVVSLRHDDRPEPQANHLAMLCTGRGAGVPGKQGAALVTSKRRVYDLTITIGRQHL
jgi:hypothetical protein